MNSTETPKKQPIVTHNGNPVKVKHSGRITWLTITLVILKLTGLIAWSWWWIFSPSWLFVGLMLLEIVYRIVKYEHDWSEGRRIVENLSKYPQLHDKFFSKIVKGDVFQSDGNAWRFLGNSPIGGPDDVNEMREAIAKGGECSGHCGLNYCDENGCVNRKRNYVSPELAYHPDKVQDNARPAIRIDNSHNA